MADLYQAVASLVGKDGITLNNVGDEAIKLVPSASHGDVAGVLNMKLKDLFEHEQFPSGVHMGQLNDPARDGSRRHPEDCVTNPPDVEALKAARAGK